MTTFPATPNPRRTALLRVAATTWVLLVSAAAIVNMVTLVKLAEQTDASAPSAQVAALESRLAEFGQLIEQAGQQPAALPLARYDTDRLALDQRLSAIEHSIEHALGSLLAAESLQPLRARIEQVEAQLIARPTAAAPALPRVVVKAKPAEPPFRIVGAELRAGEQFLSILPSGTAALTQVRLLRVGEEEVGWRLDSIDGATAVFRHGGNTRRLAVPSQ